MKQYFKMDNHARICVVLPLNGFGSTYLILICGQFLLANGACMGIVTSIIVVCMGIEENSMHGPAHFLLLFPLFYQAFEK